MNPDLEFVHTRKDESFKAWVHDYPHTAAKWHFHAEYEVHVIRHTTGTFFVGDHIGEFGPGNLVVTGPNLPHNWVCDIEEGAVVPLRDGVLQFSRETAERMVAAFPELQPMMSLLDEAARGIQFPDALGIAIMPLMVELSMSHGARRIGLLMALFEQLMNCTDRTILAGPAYDLSGERFMSSTINQVLAHIQENLAGTLRETDVADLAGMSISTFIRFFRKSTGTTFMQYLLGLRINKACELLMCSNLSVTDICFQTGFNNQSNFNRQFLAAKGMSPSKYRTLHQRHGGVMARPASVQHAAISTLA
jgi:AraC-like DNA-binding protein